jgi:C_GCAxxG_C_C family probable redox protein
MSKVEKAVEYFTENYNCSQAIFATYGQEFGIPLDQAFKITSGFGGGMRIGGTCGAVTGAFMILGLKFARGKDKPYDKIIEFAEKFCQRNQSTNCLDLIGCDIRTEQGMKKAIDEGLFRTVCTQMVKDSAEILEMMLTDDRSN